MMRICYSAAAGLHLYFIFFFNDTAPTEIYTLSLHDALPIYGSAARTPARGAAVVFKRALPVEFPRSEEHTSELQSHSDLVCRLLLEKKKKKNENVEEDFIMKNTEFSHSAVKIMRVAAILSMC